MNLRSEEILPKENRFSKEELVEMDSQHQVTEETDDICPVHKYHKALEAADKQVRELQEELDRLNDILEESDEAFRDVT